MAANNNCTFLGNLTKDVVLQQVGESNQVGRFSLAIEGFKDKATGKKKVTFPDFEIWNDRANALAQYAKKGDKVLVTAEFQVDEYEDKKTGEKRRKPKFRVSDFSFAGGARPKGEDEAEDETEEVAAAAPAKKGKDAAKPAAKKPAKAQPEPDENDLLMEDDEDELA